MCDKCSELDKRIAHYERLALSVLDKGVVEGIHFLVAKYNADKKALHPD